MKKKIALSKRKNLLINAGVYCFNWENLSKIISTLKSNKKNEIYLTDTVSFLRAPCLEIEDDRELQESITGYNSTMRRNYSEFN